MIEGYLGVRPQLRQESKKFCNRTYLPLVCTVYFHEEKANVLLFFEALSFSLHLARS